MKTVKIIEKSVWTDAWIRLKCDRMGMIALVIVIAYAVMAILSFSGLIAADWQESVGESYAPPSMDHIFGTDIFGRSVFKKVIHASQVAMSVGLVASVCSAVIGVIIGSISGYFGKWVDDLVVWFYTTISSVPTIMLLMSIAFVMGKGITTIYIALAVTGWVGLCRLIRGEVMKHKSRDYVQAAEAIGASHSRRLFKHILPNVMHIVIINTSLQFQVAIKSEVILSYLGVGVVDQPSWGTMIDDAKLELVRGVWWQLAAATLAMFIIVLAFNILGDSLRDALDPKLNAGKTEKK
jgi:ABC-type dipeptide/oligopeptide/nickel transport system permease subunit